MDIMELANRQNALASQPLAHGHSRLFGNRGLALEIGDI